jgi:hypothetical protein
VASLSFAKLNTNLPPWIAGVVSGYAGLVSVSGFNEAYQTLNVSIAGTAATKVVLSAGSIWDAQGQRVQANVSGGAELSEALQEPALLAVRVALGAEWMEEVAAPHLRQLLHGVESSYLTRLAALAGIRNVAIDAGETASAAPFARASARKDSSEYSTMGAATRCGEPSERHHSQPVSLGGMLAQQTSGWRAVRAVRGLRVRLGQRRRRKFLA